MTGTLRLVRTLNLLEESASPALAVSTVREPGQRVIVRDVSGKEVASTDGAGRVPDLEAGTCSEARQARGYFATSLRVWDSGRTVEVYAGLLVGTSELRTLDRCTR